MSALLSRTAQVGECLIWQGATQSRGYGCVSAGSKGKTKLAHRAVYEETIAAIPAGMTIDHLCRNKLCLNVAHMEVVTRAENTRRKNAAVTHCPRGHEYTPENTYVKRCGAHLSRQCRECRRAASRAARASSQAGLQSWAVAS